ncbi:MAG: C10 family peptidase, partial [Muribaculaceae bacterium]|nr:C10 family peptidase [Muribaculaceae bacterium]
LMKACGYAVKMEYGTDSSGALAMNIANGLVKYLGYDPNILYDMRMYYSASEWDRMIYDNLKNVGPILYGGASMLGGGHSFVLDGYDADSGLYHFNWGWSDMSDGYYSLDALNPDALGIGGGSGGGYNFTQDAVFGIQPPTGKPVETRPLEITQHGSLTAEVEEGLLKFNLDGEGQAMWVNYNPQTIVMKFGAVFEPQGDTGGEVVREFVSDTKFAVQPGYGTNPKLLVPSLELAPLNLRDGTYKVTFSSVLIETGGDDVWTPVRPGYGYVNYVVLKKSGNSYTVENTPVDYIELVDAKYLNKLYFGGLAKVQIDVVNDSDIELTKGFAPVLINATTGQITFVGESVYITLQPKTSATRTWTTALNLVVQANITADTDFYIAFLDEGTGNFFASEEIVVMHPNPGVPSLQLGGAAVIKGAKSELAELPDGQQAYISVIDDPTDINVSASVRLKSGIFCYNLLAFLVKPDFGDASGQVEILTLAGTPAFMESEGLRVPFSAKLSYPSLISGEYYAIMMGYQYGSNYVALQAAPTYFRLDGNSSGVSELPDADVTEEDGEIFNLQGISVGNDLNSLPAGLYIRNGKKILKK